MWPDAPLEKRPGFSDSYNQSEGESYFTSFPTISLSVHAYEHINNPAASGKQYPEGRGNEIQIV